jgi:hypothetical protein
MIQAMHQRLTRTFFKTLLTAAALEGIVGTTRVAAQIIAIGPPSFQSNDFPSMETMILDRLAMGGRYNPQDLGTLAHLSVLESIAAIADVQADYQTSILGTRLEIQLRELWDAAATFEESVSAGPLDARTLTRIQPLYSEMQAAYQGVESTLSASAGMSSRAAAHLRNIDRLTAATSAMMGAIESDLIASVPRSTERSASPEFLEKQTRLLANDTLVLIENVKASKHPNSGWNAVKEDLQELFNLLQAFQKALTNMRSSDDMSASLHTVRRRLWRTEARIVKLGWPADLERKWRDVRVRLNLIGDELGLPQVIDLATRAGLDQPPAPLSSAKPTTRIYRGPP